jgi:hypothetical protein
MRMVVCYGIWSSLVTHSLPSMKLLLQDLSGPDICWFEEVPNFSGELLECQKVPRILSSPRLQRNVKGLWSLGELRVVGTSWLFGDVLTLVETNCRANPIYYSLLGSSALSPPCFPLQKQGCRVVKLTGRLSQGNNVEPKSISSQHAWRVGEENGTMNRTKIQSQ